MQVRIGEVSFEMVSLREKFNASKVVVNASLQAQLQNSIEKEER